MSEHEQQNQSSSPGQRTMVDEIAFTIDELYKAIQHVNYISGTVKSTDWSVFTKLFSAKNLGSMAKSIDLKQISELLQSPLVRQLLSDPELLALFLPDLAAQPHSQQQNQRAGAMPPWGVPYPRQQRPQQWPQQQSPQQQGEQQPGKQVRFKQGKRHAQRQLYYPNGAYARRASYQHYR